MTREQAIALIDDMESFTLPSKRERNEMFIDKLVALNLLQVSAPEDDNIEKMLNLIGSNRSSLTFQRTLDYFGLKIVKK